VGSGPSLLSGRRVESRRYAIGIGVNVSARQLDSDQLITDIEEALASSGLEPGALTIEITETTAHAQRR